ncbi:hypothetical protein TWF696_001943 [Orbilia brochopaga]|uniref:Uncharacterized protein n=1 Tax=Orbilia brochopaga TaxID=3140254 RepID=A0AAV9U6W9_9PEZI
MSTSKLTKFIYNPQRTLIQAKLVDTPMDFWHRHLRNSPPFRRYLKPPYTQVTIYTFAEQVIRYLLVYGHTRHTLLDQHPRKLAIVLDLCSYLFSPEVTAAITEDIAMLCNALGESLRTENGEMLELINFSLKDVGDYVGKDKGKNSDPSPFERKNSDTYDRLKPPIDFVVERIYNVPHGIDRWQQIQTIILSGEPWPVTLVEWVYAFTAVVFIEFRRRVDGAQAAKKAKAVARQQSLLYRMGRGFKRLIRGRSRAQHE